MEGPLAQKIKLSTIADALGVSTATVSLALRDSPLVADVTRDRIKEHAREIGYIYNRRAASLRTSRSGIVGVVVHDIMNPFYAEILRSIESELDRSRQTFILSNHYDDLEKQRTFVDTLLQLGADGVIMSPAIGTPPEDIIMAEENGLPAVLIARSVEGADVPVFRGDDAYGTALATNHLISLGHKRIAMIGGTDQTSTGRHRYQGYRQRHGSGGPRSATDLAHRRTAHQAGRLRGGRTVPGPEGQADRGLLLERPRRHRPDERHRARRPRAGHRRLRHRLRRSRGGGRSRRRR
jgi:DNA-binding LacI/PurR family transcriptional regulator